MNKIYDTLYHQDENGNTRIWYMEQDGDSYRTISGIEGGNLVTSEWKLAKGKNVGRSNETTGEEQATAEIKSQYTKKLDRKYHTSKETIESGSKIIEPMLAATYKGWNPYPKSGFIFSQPKLDGMRCIATKDGLFSRQGKPILSCPHIVEALKEEVWEFYPDFVLDGELYNHELRDNFNELLSLARQSKPTPEDWAKSKSMIQYHLYDVIPPWEECFLERTHMVSDVVFDASVPFIVDVRTILVNSEEELDAEYAQLLEQGYEGQMIRNGESSYEHKRTKSLLKRKEFVDEEYPIVSILEGQGNWSGYAKSVTCRNRDGSEFNAGIKGNQAFTKELLHRDPVPKTVTVRYQNLTPDNVPRFPIAVAFYENERDT